MQIFVFLLTIVKSEPAIFVANKVSDLIKMTKIFSMHTHTTPCSVVPFSKLRCTKGSGGGGGAADFLCSDRNNSNSNRDIYMKFSGKFKEKHEVFFSANFHTTDYDRHTVVTRFLRKLQFLAKKFG